jgi:hypothetical protein
MAVVAIVAVGATALIEVKRSWERRSRYASTLQDCRAYKVDYEQGRGTLVQAVERSRRLGEAELALCWKNEARIAAIEAHLARASSLIEEEINRPWSLHDTDIERAPEIEWAKASLVAWRTKLIGLVRTR